MKHMKHLLTTMAVLLYSLVASAQTKVEIDGIWYNLVSKAKQAEVTYQGDDEDSYQEYSGSITIPTAITYDGVEYSVTKIGDNAFWDCSSLTAINIPESVTSIGGDAFYGCSSLTDINIPKGVTSIEDWTFYGCSSLVTIIIPKGVISIGGDAFYGCSSLTTVTIPSDSQLKSIKAGAFDGCSSLVDITIPKSVTSIEFAAFQYCSSLTAITIPMGVKNIGEQTFRYCSNLTSITLPGVTSIGDDAFFYCENLATITLSTWMTNIGESAFCGCRSLSAITIPKGINEIKSYTFYRCSSLTSITIPEGVTKIDYCAFKECSSLTSITIPQSISSIGGMFGETFSICSGLTDVYCYAENIPITKADIFEGSYVEYATLHVPTSALASYKAKAPWTNFGIIVSLTDEKVTSITLNHTEGTLTEGGALTLTATIAPGYATNKAVSWSSSNPSVATVDNTGKVTAIAPGTAIIIATAGDGSGVSAQCEVTVEAKTTEVEITINQYGSGTYCSEYALDFSNVEGLKAYAAAGYNNITGVVTLLRLNTSQPGEGLFIKGEPGKYMVPVMVSTGDNTLNMLVGTLAKTAVNKTSADGLYRNFRYTTKTGVPTPMFYEIADGYTLSANKAYLQIPTAWLPAEAKSISLRFDEGEGTTDIDASTLNPQPSTEVYDLYGRRVDNPVKGGIYIIGGKKVIIK